MAKLLTIWLMNWIIRGTKFDAEPDGRGWLMQFCSRDTKAHFLLTMEAAGFVVLSLILVLDEPKAASFILLGFTGLMFLWVLYSLIDSDQRLITLDDDGLTIHRPFRGPYRIEWAEIQSVFYSETFWAIKIRPARGSSASIGVTMNGLGTLAWYLDQHAPGTIALEARRFLPNSHDFLSQGVKVNTK